MSTNFSDPATSFQIAKRFKNKKNLHTYISKRLVSKFFLDLISFAP